MNNISNIHLTAEHLAALLELLADLLSEEIDIYKHRVDIEIFAFELVCRHIDRNTSPWVSRGGPQGV